MCRLYSIPIPSASVCSWAMRRLVVIQKAKCPKPHGSMHRPLMLADDRSKRRLPLYRPIAIWPPFSASLFSKLVCHVHFCSSLNYSSNLRIEKYATGTTTYTRGILAHRLLTINRTSRHKQNLRISELQKREYLEDIWVKCMSL